MRRAATIHFDAPRRVDRVALAIGRVDAVTGTLVRDGIDARITGLPDRPVRNASGLLVFVNLPKRPQYEVEVDGRRAGFPFVERFIFTAPSAGEAGAEARRRNILLTPGPEHPFAPGTTLIRGVVKRGSNNIANASITTVPAGGRATFTARSMPNGAFALALRLPPLGTHEAEGPVRVSITISEGGDTRTLLRPIVNGRSHSFREPIDLGGSNEPGFFAP